MVADRIASTGAIGEEHMNTKNTLACCFTVVASMLVGCESGQLTTSKNAGLTGPSPMSEKARMRHEAWVRATIGLHFNEDTGRMEIEPLPGLDQKAIDELVLLGDDHIQNNRNVEAFGAYGRWVRAEPMSNAAYNAMAMSLVPQGKSDLSEMILRTALDVDASSSDSWSNMAKVQATQGRHAEAIKSMERAIALDPSKGESWERLAVWQFYAGDVDAAADSVDRALELGASVPAQLVANIERAKQ